MKDRKLVMMQLNEEDMFQPQRAAGLGRFGHSSGSGLKDRRNELQNLCLKDIAKTRHVSGVSLNGGLVERPLSEAVKLKLGWPWRIQDGRDSRVVGYLPGRDASR